MAGMAQIAGLRKIRRRTLAQLQDRLTPHRSTPIQVLALSGGDTIG
jgi:hypothetical protein